LQNLQPIDVRKHDIENNGVRSEFSSDGNCLDAFRGSFDLPAFIFERHLKKVREGRLIVNHEHANL
jgi:hypothetical protein